VQRIPIPTGCHTDIFLKGFGKIINIDNAIYSFARKCGQALASGLTGLLLTIIGYSAATQNDPDVVDGIYNITCLAPALGFVLVVIGLVFIYPLNKKKVEENAAILKERREKGTK
jgi:GPH family glycoside/pentoside/hexuronide:cation symporter